ncbi:hypothetical protein BD770DRAFT_432648 [Pilaira anomala]|nr:hypothetical protein BD770DRAFT_432648 [Pilaira anomala]
MSPLPFEILTLTFKNLETEEILQCQLTSKKWYMASVELLYSKLTIDTTGKAFRFARTISNSPRLGNYLKNIDTKYLFMKNIYDGTWDEHGLLSTLIQQCPNLLKLESQDLDLSFWTQLSYAATKGQLPRLRSLPSPEKENLGCYLYTALLFKASLTSLVIHDIMHCFGLDLSQLEVYQMLLDQIKEFKNLQTLDIQYQSNNKLSHFDALIENCSRLKRIRFELSPTKEQKSIIGPVKFINPRPDICELVCNWETIDNDSQMRYVRQKFPDLQKITMPVISNGSHKLIAAGYPLDAIVEFIRYILVIPEFDVNLKLRKQDLINIWPNLINIDDRFRNVTIDYLLKRCYSHKIVLNLTTKSTIVRFLTHKEDIELPHVRFFLEIGNMVQLLTIKNTDDELFFLNQVSPLYSTLTGLVWIFQIIQMCPLLQELSISELSGNILSTQDISQHTGIKKLSITNVAGPGSPVELLMFMSLSLPNLKQVHLTRGTNEWYICRPVIVMMQDTWLDLLTWTNLPARYRTGKSLEAYIKLTTNTGVKYYLVKQIDLLQINERDYNASSSFRFDITCKTLKKFVIIDDRYFPPHKLACTF